jgi:hypothetical protein
MRVTRRVAARAVFDEHALDALPGTIWQLVLVDESYLGVLRLPRFREHAAERLSGDKQRTDKQRTEDQRNSRRLSVYHLQNRGQAPVIVSKVIPGEI